MTHFSPRYRGDGVEQVNKNTMLGNDGVLFWYSSFVSHPSALYYEAGFAVSKVTSGLTLGFRSYDAGSLLTGVDLHGNLCWTPNLLRSRFGVFMIICCCLILCIYMGKLIVTMFWKVLYKWSVLLYYLWRHINVDFFEMQVLNPGFCLSSHN